MSARSEVKEFVEWIAALLAEHEPAPTPEPVLKDAWERVKENLDSASTNFGKASDALLEIGQVRIVGGCWTIRRLSSERMKRPLSASLLATWSARQKGCLYAR